YTFISLIKNKVYIAIYVRLLYFVLNNRDRFMSYLSMHIFSNIFIRYHIIYCFNIINIRECFSPYLCLVNYYVDFFCSLIYFFFYSLLYLLVFSIFIV